MANWTEDLKRLHQPLPQSRYAQALNGGYDLGSGLRAGLNRPMMNPLPADQAAPRFNPTLMQGKNLVAEVMPGIGDAKAIADAQDPNMPGWLKALNYASTIPGIGDMARLGGNAAMPLMGAMTAFHGSPHKFSKFDLSKIGTGEGAQAYGHGLYFAESPGVAGVYRNKLSTGDIIVNGQKWTQDAQGVYRNVAGKTDGILSDAESLAIRGLTNASDWSVGNPKILAEEAESFLQTRHGLSTKQIQSAKKLIETGAVSPGSRGHMYEVDIPDTAIDKMLDWDKPLSEQPESVRKALSDHMRIEKAGDDYVENWLLYFGDEVIDAGKTKTELVEAFNANPAAKIINGTSLTRPQRQAASEYLNSLGIPGIKYLDHDSRIAGEGTRNFVVFDDTIPKVLSRNGEKVSQFQEKAK